MVVAVIALAASACSPSSTSAPSPPSAAVSPTTAVSSTTAAPAATPSAVPSGAPSASPGASAGASPAVPVDASLLTVLPATVNGQAVNEVPEIEAQLVTDPSLLQNASSLAVALGINMNTGDFAYVAVIQLKPLVFSNAFYSSWRQSYDEGACSQSDGLKGTGVTTIAGRQVFIGTCKGGALTYHAHLPAPDRLISITSVGSADYGSQVLMSLKP